jgi:U3 small nucleolar RNA-associated protein 19
MGPSLRSLPPSAKKRKAGVPTTEKELARIAELESALTAAVASAGSLNPLADLLATATSASDAQVVLKAVYALYRIFVLAINGGRLNAGGDEGKVVRTWIWERLNGYVDLLCGLLKDDEKTLRVCAWCSFHLLLEC